MDFALFNSTYERRSVLMKIEIFTHSFGKNIDGLDKEPLEKMKGEINAFLKEHPEARVQWFQTSGATTLGVVETYLTAVISY
ncbi:MAG: hypothetical protein BMS9Abin13_489 [Patescibacteria group bacterium]|nr:MAG: hypothetical protein BMS9Abin13_489 [Patescibacteria group bacterium]